MRFPASLLLAAAAGLAALTAAAAQDAPRAAEPPAKAAKAEAPKAAPGLSDLSATVETLQDEAPSADTAAPTPPGEPAASPPAAEPAAAQPERTNAALIDDRGVRIQPPDATAAVPVGPDGQPLPPSAPEEERPTEPAPAPSEATTAPAEPAATPAETPAETPAPVPVPGGPRFVEPLTAAQRAELAAAAARGRLLSAIAGAGQIATRDMLSRVSDPEAAGIAGWIAEPQGNGVTVSFYAEPQGDAAPSTVFRVNILGGRVVSRDVFLATESRPALNRLQARMAAARRATAAQEHRPCGADEFNYFVVPPATQDGPIDVYQISPQSARERFPAGGHFKTIVAADGTIVSTRGYTNACLEIEAPEVPAGQRAAPIAITHLLDPMPTEIHAFLSIWTGHPLVVVAGDPQRLFGVTGDGMGEIPREPAR